MTADEIQSALETAVGVPEDALRAAAEQAGAIAPTVIAVMRDMADGVLPLPRQERLLRFGLHALSVARETSACPAFLALLRRKPIELEWLFGKYGRADRTARTLLGLFDGDDAAVRAVAADTTVDDYARCGLLTALARLAWEGRASREALVDLLHRLDREELAEPGSWTRFGWLEAIMLLGLTDRIDRVRAIWEADPDIPMYDREVDREDWIKRTRDAAEHSDDPQRFIDDRLLPYHDPAAELEWSADPEGGPDHPLSADEMSWLDTALWRRADTKTMPLEWADGFLTALAVAPERLAVSAYLPAILGDDMVFDTLDHEQYIAELLERHFAAIDHTLAMDEAIEPIVNYDVGIDGALWARGYLTGIEKTRAVWQPLTATRSVSERLIVPILALLPDEDAPEDAVLTVARRSELIKLLPDIIAATRAFFNDDEHPLLTAIKRPERRVKVGRNDPCPCGSGKKYKRCCGAVA